MKELSLVDKVISQLLSDIEVGDFTAIEELLKQVPKEKLESFLGEEL